MRCKQSLLLQHTVVNAPASFSLRNLIMNKNLISLIKNLKKNQPITKKKLYKLQRKYTKKNGDLYSKVDIITGYKKYAGSHGLGKYDPNLVEQIRKKPSRTASGVTVVTVLTKPYPCPGKCIFCPQPEGMPKSYLASEPGSQRAKRNKFDPYLQTYNRVQTLANMGHPVDKIELIILGGSWSAYPIDYQIWFIRQCFRALNDIKKQKIKLKSTDYQRDTNQTADWRSLFSAQKKNETAYARNVGLVVETRPDMIDKQEIVRLRKLGATKVQIGIQFLDDKILKINKRGHGVKEISKAFQLLRSAGFKIQAHWMINLYGSNPEKDKENFLKIFSDQRFKPDELKIYPCSLLVNTKLFQLYKEKKWQPYTKQELIDVLRFCLTHTPNYCRVSRVIRDIPSTEIVAGNKLTNLRELVEKKIKASKEKMEDIRAREIGREDFETENIELKETKYQTKHSNQFFLEYVTPENKILGFLRLGLGNQAIIREIHVYGPSTPLRQAQDYKQDKVQHHGLGTNLISRAVEITKEASYDQLSVISAVGTREYYRKLGFKNGKLYQKIKI